MTWAYSAEKWWINEFEKGTYRCTFKYNFLIIESLEFDIKVSKKPKNDLKEFSMIKVTECIKKEKQTFKFFCSLDSFY